MAHADYECCCLCDERGHYSSDAAAKDVICVPCAVGLAKRGIIVTCAEELVAWVKREDLETLRTVLQDLHFGQCGYPNDADAAVIERLGVDFGARVASWAKVGSSGSPG